MTYQRVPSRPAHESYDVVIVGGATSGSSVAWHLATEPGFDGCILVVERDTTLRRSATAASNNCMRQQFATEINVRISQYAAHFVNHFRELLGDPAAPELGIRNFGYMYLADTPELAETLREDQRLQAACGAGTEMMSPAEIDDRFGFYRLDDIVAGSFNRRDEGAFDALGMVDWMRRKASDHDVDHIENDVVSMQRDGSRITSVTLGTGEVVSTGTVVNAAGTRADHVARMAGASVPVEARRRYTYIFSAEHPLDQDLPLTIDPTGVHMRSYGARDYLVGCPPIAGDPAVDVNDFEYAEPIWEQKMQPVIENRIPALGELRVTDSWVGHYEYNSFDQNAIVGPHHEVENLVFCVGFSGHGSQQAPACGRGIAELITHGEFRTLDLSPLGYRRIADDEPLIERAVI